MRNFHTLRYRNEFSTVDKLAGAVREFVWLVAAENFIHPNVVTRDVAAIGARSAILKGISSRSICFGNLCKKIKGRSLKNNPSVPYA